MKGCQRSRDVVWKKGYAVCIYAVCVVISHLAHEDGHGESHAPLARRAEG